MNRIQYHLPVLTPNHSVRQGGFSLIEVMIVVIIVGILSVSALNWGNEYAANNRVRKTAETLQAVLALARNEAIKTNRPATVRLVNLNWFLDTVDPTNVVQRSGSFTDNPNSPTPEVAITPTNINITFSALGGATSGQQTFNLTKPSATCQPSGKVRCLDVRLGVDGQSIMCDPQLTYPADPRGCPP